MDNTAPKYTFGFWLYLMTDCVLFATLFATYAVLRTHTYGGPSSHELFNLRSVLIETLILLVSSFTCGLAVLAAQRGNKEQVLAWFWITFFLGVAFLGLELREFSTLIHDGNGPQRSAFLSSFFTLVGTHGLHIATGLIGILILMAQTVRRGLTPTTVQNLTSLSLFWHFLDIIWIFIFTIVYLMGVL